MGDAQHLLMTADAGHLLSHLLGGPAADTGVHLVKHHGGHMILLAEDVLHGQHNAGQLAAGGDLVDGLQLLAQVGGHEEPHLIHTGGIQRLLGKVHLKADLAHIQLPQLRQDGLGQRLTGGLAGGGQLLRGLAGGLLRLGAVLLQPGQRVARVGNVVQLLTTVVQIRQHVLHRRAVLLFQAVELIQPALHLVQFVGGEIEVLPLLRHGKGDVIRLAVCALQTLVQGVEALIQMAHGPKRVLGLPQQVQHAAAVLTAVQGIVRPRHGGDELLGIPQQIAAALQLFLLAAFQLGPLQLAYLILQGVHPPRFFRLVHLQGVHFAAYLC